MIYDPKRLNDERPSPPSHCPGCGRLFEPDDQIVLDSDSARGTAAMTYWHRSCRTRHIETVIAEGERRIEEAARRDRCLWRRLDQPPCLSCHGSLR